MVKPKPRFKSKAGRIRKPQKSTRWAKGDSCLSNPENRKFRDEASSLYFHEVIKNPLLTVKNLGAHQSPELDEDVLSSDIQSLTVSDARTGVGSFASYRTFASDWSKCSNGAFEKFLGRFKLDSGLHKEMLSILAATTEVINSMGGTHRESEYFASFITALEQCDPSQYQAMMALLSIVSGRVPEGVLRKTFSTIYPKVGAILVHAMDSFDNGLMRVTCDVLKKILGAQEPYVFEVELPVQGLIYGILQCAIHDNPKVRRKGRQTIGFIFNRQKEKNGNEVIAKIVLGWILDQLATYPTCGSKSAAGAMGVLLFVWSNLDTVSSGGAKKLFESVLRVMSSGDMSLVKIGFSFFSEVFQTRLTFGSSSLKTGSEFTPKLITALWDFCPDWRNSEAFLLWVHCIMNGLIRLTEEEPQLAGGYISRIMTVIAPTWASTWGVVPSKVFVGYLFHLIQPDTRHEDIDACFQVISRNLISLPPNEHCLTVLTGFLESLKSEQFTITAREVLLQLLQIRNSAAARRVSTILGQFVKAFGISNLWGSVDPEIRRSVILPLIRDNLSGGSFSYWKEHIFPLCKSQQYVEDVWGSLVGFSRDPVDPENFPAKLVGETGVKTPAYRLTALAALRQLSLWPQARNTLQKHGMNYLTILFNQYIQERQVAIACKKKMLAAPNPTAGHSDAIATTIQAYLTNLEPKFIQYFMQEYRVLDKFNECSPEEKGPILDLLTFLSGFEINERVSEELFHIASPLVSDESHMKGAYRLLQSLFKNESVSKEIKAQIVNVLRENKGKTKSNAEPFRLDCIIALVLENEEYTAEFLPEAILSLLSVNKRARQVAIKFVGKLAQNLKDGKISLEKMESVVRLGMESGNSFIISCTIHFLIQVYLLAPPPHPDPSLINSSINHLLEEQKWDASVSREALTFLSLNLSIYKSEMGPFAAAIGKVLSIGNETHHVLPRKETNKILARMIRIFGVAGLKAVLTNSDDPKMNIRIKNIQRKLRKLKETRSTTAKQLHSKEDENSEESEEEGEDVKSGRSHHSNEKLIIKEGVVDFLDPKNMTASLINKPKESKDGDEFKVSTEGKLIIEDLDGRRGQKRSLEEEFPCGKSDDDDGDDDELEPRRGKKIKRHAGGSVGSRRSVKSSRSLSSKTSRKSSGTALSKVGTLTVSNRARAQLKARKSSSTQSVRSGNSSRSKGSVKKRFN